MPLSVNHSVVVTGVNDPGKQVSKDAWNAAHPISGVADFSQGGTNATSYTADRLLYATSTALSSASLLAYATSGDILTVTAGAATDVPLTVRGATSQSVNLQEWRNSAGTVQASVSAAGNATVGNLTVRQPGGTAGVDQLDISHDGTRATLTSQDGGVRVRARSGATHGERILEITRADGSTGDLDACYFFLSGSQVFFSVPFIVVRQSYDSENRIRLGSGAGVSFTSHPVNAGTRSGVRDGGAMGVVDLFGGADGARANASGGTLASAPFTPALLTVDVNNYDPAGGNGHYRNYRLSSDAARTITGLVSAPNGTEIRLINVGTNSIVLAHQSASSTAVNRLLCTGGANITLAADEQAVALYDAVTQRWRVVKGGV